jgi:hypothetical protein
MVPELRDVKSLWCVSRSKERKTLGGKIGTERAGRVYFCLCKPCPLSLTNEVYHMMCPLSGFRAAVPLYRVTAVMVVMTCSAWIVVPQSLVKGT